MPDTAPDEFAPSPAVARYGAGPAAALAGFALSTLGFSAGQFTSGTPAVPPPPLFRRSLLPPRLGTRAPQ